MYPPSLQRAWADKVFKTPRIYVLEVRDREQADADPIACLLIEREETYRKYDDEESPYEASINISYEHIEADALRRSRVHGDFSGCYKSNAIGGPAVSLTSTFLDRGAVYLDPPQLRGQRIGTYFMNEVVNWVKQWPDAVVQPIELLAAQASTANKARRNRFYEQFGLVFDYVDSERREGRSRPMRAGSLTPVETWNENLAECCLPDYLCKLLVDDKELRSELLTRDRAFRGFRDELRSAERRPLRWAIQVILRRIFYRF